MLIACGFGLVFCHRRQCGLFPILLLFLLLHLQLAASTLGVPICLRLFGSHGSSNWQFKHARLMAWDQQGNVVVADADNHRLQVIRLLRRRLPPHYMQSRLRRWSNEPTLQRRTR